MAKTYPIKYKLKYDEIRVETMLNGSYKMKFLYEGEEVFFLNGDRELVLGDTIYVSGIKGVIPLTFGGKPNNSYKNWW